MGHRKSNAQHSCEQLSWGMESLEVLEDVLQVAVGRGEVQESQSSIQGLVQEEVQESQSSIQGLVQEEVQDVDGDTHV